jgi:hypothetical protein
MQTNDLPNCPVTRSGTMLQRLVITNEAVNKPIVNTNQGPLLLAANRYVFITNNSPA